MVQVFQADSGDFVWGLNFLPNSYSDTMKMNGIKVRNDVRSKLTPGHRKYFKEWVYKQYINIYCR